MPDLELADFVDARLNEHLTRTANDVGLKQALTAAYRMLPSTDPSAAFLASIVEGLASQWSEHPQFKPPQASK